MTDRERDAAMERLLREAMAGVERPAASECLDAETLAAWMDATLSARERSFAEAHASRCGRCRAVLAAMTRSLPASPEPAPSFLRRWLFVLGPAAATAAAVTLWFAVSPSPLETPQSSTAMSDAPAPSVPPPPLDSPQTRIGPVATQAAPAEARAKDAGTAAEKKVAADGSRLSDARREQENLAKEAARQTERDSLSKPVAPPAVTAAAPPNATPIPAAPAAPPVLGQQGGAAGGVAAGAPMQSDQRFRAGVDDLQRADAAGRAGARAANEVYGYTNVGRGAEIIAPGSLVRWRVVAGRTIQQSVDGGRIWATQYVADERVVLIAGAAATTDDAWFVGAGGAVFHTADGLTWQRVAFPEPVNLVAVTVDGVRSATVTAADKRVFVTSDGGRSWSARQH
jgi:Photosynthesis system II assembly factor YCF48